VLPALGVAALYAIARLLIGSAPAPVRLVDEWDTLRGRAVLLAAAAVPALLAAAFAAGQMLVNISDDWLMLLTLVSATFLVTLLVTLTALNLRARLARRGRQGATDAKTVREWWNTRGAITRMTMVVAFAALPFFVIFAGTIGLNGAKVCVATSSGVRSVHGVFIGETSSRTYIGQSGGQHPFYVFSIPQSKITETIIGGKPKHKPRPACLHFRS
jgi:hypothetical protein